MVSTSSGEGPGPVISRGFTERRVLKNSIGSEMAALHLLQRAPAAAIRGRGLRPAIYRMSAQGSIRTVPIPQLDHRAWQ
jgi:hypothetical protein